MADDVDRSGEHIQRVAGNRRRDVTPASATGTKAQRPERRWATRREAIGITSALAGSAIVVARWKYHAIGKRKRQLDDGRDKQSSSAALSARPSDLHQPANSPPRDRPDFLQSAAQQAHLNAKFRRPRGQREIVFRRIEISQRAFATDRIVRRRIGTAIPATAITERKVSWKLASNSVRGFTSSMPSAAMPSALSAGAIAKQQSREQVDVQRDGRAHDGRAEVGDERVAPGKQDGEDRRPGLAEGQLAQRPKDGESQDADVDPRDNEDVIGAGALEVGLDVAAEKRAAADERRLHQCAALARPELA